MPATPADAALQALIDAAWAAHFDDPARIGEFADALLARAPAGSAAQGWGWLHRCWAARFARQAGQAAEAMAQARRLFESLDERRGLACLDDIQLRMRLAGGEAIGELPDVDTMAPQRGPWERLISLYGHFAAADRHSRPDAALTALYRAVGAARDTGHAGAMSNTLAMLGAKHADVSDLEPARAFCAEALALVSGQRPGITWQIAALNLLFVAVEQGDAEAARPLADSIVAEIDQVLPHAVEQAHIVVARARLLAGDTAAARAALSRSRGADPASPAPAPAKLMFLGDWTAAHVECLLAVGDEAAALAACQAWLASGGDRAQFTTHSQTLRVHRAAAAAAEALGRPAEALAHERAAFQSYELQMGRAARTRRLALSIEHELARERWQREQAEAERARLDAVNRALEEANAAKTRFLAAASHDLRQPVQALTLNMAALEIESRGAATPAQHELVQRMAGSLQALSGMFDVLLDISRLDAGIVPVNPQPVALAPLLQRLHDELVASATARGLRLRLHLPARAASASTRSDPVLLERCLRNLLDNALKYTERGGVLLALRRRQSQWRVQVLDTGIGMTPEVMARACEEFYQADNPERDRRRGLGLGLSIVQRMLRLLGHGMTLASRAGRGTGVSLVLEAGAAVVADPLPALADGPGTPGVLAVIDDDPGVREGLASLLQRWGHEVLHAPDAEGLLRAWQATGRPPVQALVTDLRLARHRTGLDAVALLRQAWGDDLPALVITGDIAPDRLEALRASGLPWLAKPVMPMRLRGWLAALRPLPADGPPAAGA